MIKTDFYKFMNKVDLAHKTRFEYFSDPLLSILNHELFVYLNDTFYLKDSTDESAKSVSVTDVNLSA